jgi:hypothetical protein
MSLHRNRVQMTVTGTPGTGTITLNAATSGYQSFGTAYSSADATVDILITEGTSWEVARNCTYTHSGTTVTRGTFEASSSGSAVSFTSAAIVSVIATAATGNNWGLNEVQSNADAAVTGVVGTMHILDIGPFTADRDFTLPATCAVGDRVGVFIKTGDPDYELLLKPASGDTINGGSAGAEWSRLFISNERVIFRCIAANSDWIVEYDGRIPCQMVFRLTTQTNATEGVNTFVVPTARSGVWTANKNIGDAGNTGTSQFVARRDAVVTIGGWGFPINNLADGQYFQIRIIDGTPTSWAVNQNWTSGSGITQMGFSGLAPKLVGEYLEFQYRSSAGSKGLAAGTTFCVAEVL